MGKISSNLGTMVQIDREIRIPSENKSTHSLLTYGSNKYNMKTIYCHLCSGKAAKALGQSSSLLNRGQGRFLPGNYSAVSLATFHILNTVARQFIRKIDSNA